MDMFSVGVGIAIGLGLAASGSTASKIAAFAEAKIDAAKAATAHSKAVTGMVALYTLPSPPQANVDPLHNCRKA